MKKTLLAVITIVLTLLVWAPFLLKVKDLPGWHLDFSEGISVVWKNFDGPNYLQVAKSWYDKETIRKNFSYPLPIEYYPAHLPLYPAMVSAFNLILPGPWAMLVATLMGSVLLSVFFYKYVSESGLNKKALVLSLLLLIFPARLLIVRSVGSPEPWFLLFILVSLYQFKKGKYWLSALFVSLAQLTKSPGILLFLSYGFIFLIDLLKKKRNLLQTIKDSFPFLLVPLSILGLFSFYHFRTGDFWAYFHSGDNFHLFFPPFSIFSPQGQFWTGEFWLEDVIWIWVFYGIGILRLFEKGRREEAIFSAIFYASTLFVAHRDVSRYILPIAPLILLGWSEVLTKKKYRFVWYLVILPIFLYAWNFMLHNQAPVADWAPYL